MTNGVADQKVELVVGDDDGIAEGDEARDERRRQQDDKDE
jgi:hypothetical protein